jgi:predicted metalloendopeptidase
LGRLLDEIPLEDWKSYYAFRVLDGRANYLSEAFVQARFDYRGRIVGGLVENQPRWRRGTQLINTLIGEAVGRVYVERHFPPAAKARMEEMVRNLLAAFGDGIDDLDWMTEETKVRAEEKRRKFTYKIGYPDEWRDYSALVIDRGDLLGNVQRGSAFEYDRELAKLGGPVDRKEWGMTPQTVNAYFNATMNEIVFPAAILQPPFFDMEADDAVNYGGIGAVIGHEIGHAFDDNGRNFDGDGNMQSWWNETDDQAFRARGDRLVEHFGRYEPVPGVNVNGRLTLGENIGDLTGVTIAYEAYLKSLGGVQAPVIDGLSGAERYFIGWAQIWRAKARDEQLRSQLLSDSHSPAEVRVNGPLLHVPAFYETFGVQPGDGMWLAPEERVKIW